MQLHTGPVEIEGRQFEAAVEDLRLQAFRIYESVRAAQREHDAPVGERVRSLSAAASLGLKLVEDAQRISWEVAAVCEGDPRASAAVSTAPPRANDLVRAAS